MAGIQFHRAPAGGIKFARDGSAATPILSWRSDPNTGIYRLGADILGLACGGGTPISLTNTQINLSRNVVLTNGTGTEMLFTGDTQTDIKSEDSIFINFDSDGDGAGAKVFEIQANGVTRLKIHDTPLVIQQGGDSDTPAAYQYKAADGLTNATGSSLEIKPGEGRGTDKAGSNLLISGGQPTGSGASGPIIFQIAAPGGTGTTVRNHTERARIDNAGLTIADGFAIVAGSTSGLKIGTATTQKIGLYGVTPVVQSAAYTVTNPSTDRTLNVSADTTAQVAAVLGTLIADLKALGAIG